MTKSAEEKNATAPFSIGKIKLCEYEGDIKIANIESGIQMRAKRHQDWKILSCIGYVMREKIKRVIVGKKINATESSCDLLQIKSIKQKPFTEIVIATLKIIAPQTLRNNALFFVIYFY
ncbi:MAG TPA: hypothetical protein DEA89_03295 [Candidatus Moranbacteria bacterium]|nr:hypothetical protein [Candidatus Moranbacteria bacterium]HBI50442.1 hypothetical protein [Candidatus Moranbacteria bacterium]HBU10911.1 hypothetical protein [Candidatus Moranbacteria bacterium]HCO99451.1 hypothetical protein [Candidatus Moranbacteria bacterium]